MTNPLRKKKKLSADSIIIIVKLLLRTARLLRDTLNIVDGEYLGKSVIIKWDDKELIVIKWRGQKWPRFKLKGRLSNFTVIDYFIAEEEDDEYIRNHQSPPPHWDIFK